MFPDCLAGTRITLVNRVFVRGSSRLLIVQIIRFQCFAAITKRDCFKYSKRSLFHVMVDGDMCAPKGPRAHTMSPPLLGCEMIKSLVQNEHSVE